MCTFTGTVGSNPTPSAANPALAGSEYEENSVFTLFMWDLKAADIFELSDFKPDRREYRGSVRKKSASADLLEGNPTPSAFGSSERTFGVTKSAVVCDGDSVRKEVMYYVYSLRCEDGYYVGCCQNLKERISRHKNGSVPVTQHRLPVELEFYFATEDKNHAFDFEEYLKSGSGRACIKRHFT